MKVIRTQEKLSKFSDYWSPKIVGELNDNYIKLAKFKGVYVWHKHDNEDELFFVLSGQLRIELKDQTLELNPGDLVVIPKGVEHRPVAAEEVEVMLIEPKGTVSTGDSKDTSSIQSTTGEWI